MSYATIDDMNAAYPVRDLVQLTNEDPAATSVNADALQRQLDDASVVIDTYIESRFTLPFPDGEAPPILGILCRDMAMYRLQSLRPLHDIEDARARYDDALKTLKDIRDGKLTLGINPQNAEPTIASPTVLTSTPSHHLSHVFDRHTLRGL